MTYYAQYDKRNNILNKGECRCLSDFIENIEISKDIYDNIEKYKYDNGVLVLDPDYETKLAQQEAERVANLKMTPRDFLLAVVEIGVDYSKIKELMTTNPRVEIELQFCNFVYRGNPLLNQFCSQFNVTTEQLDELFKTKGS